MSPDGGRWWRVVVWFGLAAGLTSIGCSDDPVPTVIDQPDAGQESDAGPDADQNDAELPFDPAECRPSTTVDDPAVAIREIEEWLVGAPTVDDPLVDALAEGEFELPAAGEQEYRTEWVAGEPDDHAIPREGMPSGRVVYAGTTIEVGEPTVMFARPDEIFQLYVNNIPQPGDVYGDGDKRVPIPLAEGENEILLRFPDRYHPEFELLDVPTDLFVNTEHATLPDLRVGADRTEPLGVHALNLAGRTLTEVRARVLENEYFNETVVDHPAVGPDSSTQIAFELDPKQPVEEGGQRWPVELEIEACQAADAVRTTVEIETVGAGETFNRAFRSPVDGSVQYYSVILPEDFDEDDSWGLGLAMHGAGLAAERKAERFTRKESMILVFPTNRHEFGFSWEEWGRLNAIETLDHARETWDVDDSRVYALGHSMGGHGTWHLGVMHPGRFAAIGPSASWATFYSYTGTNRPSDLIEPARAHSDTFAYLSNLADRGVYIVHGDADEVVPIDEAHDLYDAVTEYTDDVEFHIEEGGDHSWDGDASEGQDSMDWPPMFEFFKERVLEIPELRFEFRTPGQWIGADHSYVRLESTETPFEDAVFESWFIYEAVGDEKIVELETTNVRAARLDAAALAEADVDRLVVDDQIYEIDGQEVIEHGPVDEGKTRDAPGLLNPTMFEPFCFVYPDDRAEVYRGYAAYLLSQWSLTGNGHGCALPVELLTDEIAAQRNLIFVGVDIEEIPDWEDRPFEWDDDSYRVGNLEYDHGAGFVTFEHGDSQGAAFIATEDAKYRLFHHQPFSSRNGMPDFFFWGEAGAIAGGYFDGDWEFEEDFTAGN